MKYSTEIALYGIAWIAICTLKTILVVFKLYKTRFAWNYNIQPEKMQ